MAKLSTVSFAAPLLFLAIVAVSNTYAYIEKDVIEYPEYEPEGSYIIDVENDDLPIPPEPSSSNSVLEECTEKMTSDCSENIFVSMFQDVDVNKTCCVMLLNMGETCHFALVENVLSSNIYKANANSGVVKSIKLWNQCAIILGDESSSPLPYEYYDSSFY